MAGWHARLADGARTSVRVRRRRVARAGRGRRTSISAAITLRRGRDGRGGRRTQPAAVCDSWQTLDLEPAGLPRVAPRAVAHARGAPCPPAKTAGGARDRASRDCRRRSKSSRRSACAGSGTRTRHDRARHDSSAGDPRRAAHGALWLGRVDGKPVGAAMSYRTDECRRRLRRERRSRPLRRARLRQCTDAGSCATRDGLPAVLASSAEGRSLYESARLRGRSANSPSGPAPWSYL